MAWTELVKLLLVAAFSAGGAWAGVRTHMHYLRRDVDRANARLDEHDKQFTEIYREWA